MEDKDKVEWSQREGWSASFTSTTDLLFWVSNPVFISYHLQSWKLLSVPTGVTVTSFQWSTERKLDLFRGPKTRQNDKGFWALPEQPAQLRQVRLCCRNTQHQHPSDLTQQKFISLFISLFPTKFITGLVDCLEQIPLPSVGGQHSRLLYLVAPMCLHDWGRRQHKSPVPTNKCFSQVRLLYNPLLKTISGPCLTKRSKKG